MAKNKPYNKDQLDFLRVGYQKMSVEPLTKAFNDEFGENKKYTQIKAILNKYKIKCGRNPSDRFYKKNRVYTDEHLDFLRENFKTYSLPDLVKIFNTHFSMNKTQVQLHGIMNKHKIRANRESFFAPGHTPWNKGKRNSGLTNKGSFTSNENPKATKPLGYERVNKDNHIQVKINKPNKYTGAPTSYKNKHFIIYEQYHGPIPKDHVVIFKDNDKRNFDPSNLVAITRAEQLKLNQNGYNQHQPEIKPAVFALSKLQVQVSKKEKEKE